MVLFFIKGLGAEIWPFCFYFGLIDSIEPKTWNAKVKKKEKKEENFRQNFRNLTWSYLNELTWAEWLIWYDLLIWPDQLIRSGWFADQLIRLISSWSDQLIKKFQKKNLKILFEKKNLFWMIWSADWLIRLISSWWKEKHFLNDLISRIWSFK